MGKIKKVRKIKNEKDRKNKRDISYQIINFDIILLPKY